MGKLFSYYLENLVNHSVCLGQKNVKTLLKFIITNKEFNLGTVVFICKVRIIMTYKSAISEHISNK